MLVSRCRFSQHTVDAKIIVYSQLIFADLKIEPMPNTETASFLSPETFKSACAALPLVSIDLYIMTVRNQQPALLLGLRNNRPAQDFWFTPGGRIRKNEAMADAFRRIVRDELAFSDMQLADAAFLGVWDHFYSDSAFDAATSTHYVNLAYSLTITADLAKALQLPAGVGEQHRDWCWLPLQQLLAEPLVHQHVKAVVSFIIADKAGIS